MPKIKVEIEVPKECSTCGCYHLGECVLFNEETPFYNNGNNDWGFKRCDKCKQAEVDDEKIHQ